MRRFSFFLPLLALAASARAGFVVTNGTPILRLPPGVVCSYAETRPAPADWAFSDSVEHASPDGRFTAKVFAAGPAEGDWCARWLELRYPDGESLWLGSSERGIGVKWWPTQIGPVLSVENHQDTHFSECVVLRPLGDCATDGFEVLYQTAASALPHLDHSYAGVEDISVDGVLTLRHVWDYPSAANPGDGTWRIPLFLGNRLK